MARGQLPPTRIIRAAVLRRRGGPLTLEAIEMEGPREDEVLVRMVASGICRTDIDLCDGGVPGPVVLGHEGAGVVEEIGKAVRGMARGDHVVLSYQSCGRCRPCTSGHPARCYRFWDLNFGFHRLDGSNALQPGGVRGHFFGQSSFATHALATRRNMVKVAKALPLDLLAPLGCGVQTGAGTVMNSLAVKAGGSIAILGTGSVGLAAVMAARIARAGCIIAVDINPRRRALARRLGATHHIDNRSDDVTERVRAITGSGVDYVVDTTGDATLARAARGALSPGGCLALLAGNGDTESLPGHRRVLAVVQGDAVPQRFIPRLIRLYRSGRFPFHRLVTRYKFDDINRAMADARHGKVVKPVLCFD